MRSVKTSTPTTSRTREQPPGFAALVDRYLDGLESEAASKTSPAQPSSRRRPSHPPPQEELDLHGLTAAEAEKAIRRFVLGCRRLRLATLRIITGKGLHSAGPPVLPAVAEAALKTLQTEAKVHSFDWEKKRRGRSGGALVVHL